MACFPETAPAVINQDRFRSILNHIIKDPKSWNQGAWHCGTTHCIFGFAQCRVRRADPAAIEADEDWSDILNETGEWSDSITKEAAEYLEGDVVTLAYVSSPVRTFAELYEVATTGRIPGKALNPEYSSDHYNPKVRNAHRVMATDFLERTGDDSIGFISLPKFSHLTEEDHAKKPSEFRPLPVCEGMAAYPACTGKE